MIRLTLTMQHPKKAVLKVEGKIVDTEVELLAAEGARHLQQARSLVLDLDGVQFIDAKGIELLRHWVSQGIKLHGGTYFVQNLLQAHGLGAESTGGIVPNR